MAAPIRIAAPRPMPSGSARAAHTALRVESLGPLVPRTAFLGRVHSVFANACNLAIDEALLTVGRAACARGPTMLRLAGGGGDLRDRFEVGERIASDGGRIRSTRVELDLTQARTWHPAAPGPLLPPARIEAHLRDARVRLGRRCAGQRSVLDGDAAPTAAALGLACGILDIELATRHADRLIGRGEGLTPAGDDFLVGLLAGLSALLRDDPSRRRFHGALAGAIASRAASTTPIAAHALRLAAGGHWTEPLILLRNALLGGDGDDALHAALQGALAFGASSGADMAGGLLAAIAAWLPAPSEREAS